VFVLSSRVLTIGRNHAFFRIQIRFPWHGGESSESSLSYRRFTDDLPHVGVGVEGIRTVMLPCK
jgi:hypothetical protein